jgi:hypothetical protein
MVTRLTLSEIQGKVSSMMDAVETDLSSMLASMSGGSQMSVTDMINLQYKMSVYTITAQTMSAIMKDITDTMKSIVQKIS